MSGKKCGSHGDRKPAGKLSLDTWAVLGPCFLLALLVRIGVVQARPPVRIPWKKGYNETWLNAITVPQSSAAASRRCVRPCVIPRSSGCVAAVGYFGQTCWQPERRRLRQGAINVRFPNIEIRPFGPLCLCLVTPSNTEGVRNLFRTGARRMNFWLKSGMCCPRPLPFFSRTFFDARRLQPSFLLAIEIVGPLRVVHDLFSAALFSSSPNSRGFLAFGSGRVARREPIIGH